LEATNEQGQTVFETFQVTLGGGDPAETIFLGLHPDEASTTDLAEHEAIAWAGCENALEISGESDPGFPRLLYPLS